jgi:hypothetical protein
MPGGISGRLIATMVVLLCATGCLPPGTIADQFLKDYFGAVQAQNADRLYCLLAGADDPALDDEARELRRRDFDAWVLSRYAEYLEGRDRGTVPLHAEGLTLVKTFALGKGTWFSRERVQRSGDTMTIETELRFGYDHANWTRFSAGTTVYLASAPAGRVEPIVIPYRSSRISAKVLTGATVRWSLIRESQTPVCAAGWKLADARTLPESIETETLQWRF